MYMQQIHRNYGNNLICNVIILTLENAASVQLKYIYDATMLNVFG